MRKLIDYREDEKDDLDAPTIYEINNRNGQQDKYQADKQAATL